MIITDLELTNFRIHRKLKLKFKSGITGIIGDNGSGKSSIVEAIQFALTGLLFEGNKEEAISLGEDSGSVVLKFLLNDKVGTITRFLPESKVTLSYGGGIPLKKAGEIKELWDKLLQVGPEIISKVIIAQQGNIPLLFSGESSIREKVFQKIFLVPNTEKIRGAITKNYLKQLPPLLSIEDPATLQTCIDTHQKEIAAINEELESLKCLTEDEVDEFKARLRFLCKCEDDAGSKMMLDAALVDETANKNAILEVVKELEALLNSINIKDYEKQRGVLLQQKSLFQQKLKLEQQLIDNEQIIIDESEMNETKLELDGLVEQGKKLSDSLLRIKITIENNRKQIERFKQLDGQALCYTCNQPLHSVVELTKMLEAELAESKASYEKLNAEIKEHNANELSVKKAHLYFTETLGERNRIKQTLDQFKGISFSEDDLSTYSEVIETYRDYEKNLTEENLKLSNSNSKLKLLQREISALAIFEGTPQELEEEKALIANAITVNTENTRWVQSKRVELQMKEYTLDDLIQRLARSKENQEKNKKRNRYSEILSAANDALQMSNFPRKLILNYAEVVSDYLQEKLQDFNMPYTAKVADNFKIEMYDTEGRKLPKVSGGQEIQVGIALHLALHELFSQSFPLLVIDEGTTHLDTANRKAYFELVKKLKESDKLQQIIIIDHDIQLSEVVDNVIELEQKNDL